MFETQGAGDEQQQAIKGLSQELSNIIHGVTPNFEENIRRGFINAGIRLQERDQNPYGLDDILLLDDPLLLNVGNEIELTKLKLTKRPDFKIDNFKLNLSLPHIKLALNLGTLHVEGNYEVNNQNLQQLLPVAFNGLLEIDIEDVICEGIVGLTVEEDSFVVENFDLNFSTKDVTTTVTYYNRNSERVETRVTQPSIEKTLAATFWKQIESKVEEMLYLQLAPVIVEFSYSETMLDEEDTLAEYRLFAEGQTRKANLLLDSFLSSAKTFIVQNESRDIPIETFKKNFKKPPPSKDIGTFHAYDGYIGDLSTLTRRSNFSLYEDADKIVSFGSIKMRDFKYGFKKYKAQFLEGEFEGDIKSEFEGANVFIKLVVTKSNNGLVATLDSIKVSDARVIAIDLSGLGSLTWLKDRIDSWVVGHFHCKALASFTNAIRRAFQQTIPSINLVELLED